MYIYDSKRGKVTRRRSKKEKILITLKIAAITFSLSTLAFLSICTYKYFPLLKETEFIKVENISLKSLNSNHENKIEELKSYIAENEAVYDLAESINKENKALKQENLDIKEKQKGLIKYTEKKLGIEIEKIEKIPLEVTMYTDDEGWWNPGDPRMGTMASGIKTSRGAVAMPRSIPFNTEVVVDNEKLPSSWEGNIDIVHKVLDRGGAIVEKSKNGETVYCMDIWTDDKTKSKQWGRRDLYGWLVYIKKGK